MTLRSVAAALLWLILASAPAPARQDPAPDPKQVEIFESKVRPLLAARCFKCHSAEAPKPKGGLRLDSRAAALKGGDDGPAVVPGDLEKSLLVTHVTSKDPDVRMPPKEALPAGEIEILVQWIKSGAAWGKDVAAKTARKEKKIIDEDRRWWAFRPVKATPDGSIDGFIRAKLAAEQLVSAPEADRATLIRRATFDLHGLPPTPDEIDAFLKDSTPGAWERVIDRLLASPRYGERWARRWLDLVRYAESDGYKQDGYRPNAWPYRDYVVASFNSDKPYDRFVLEQLAGDEVAPDDPDVIVATGFMRHSIYEYNQRNAPGQWADILNDITDVTGDVFLGLGMGCARCHDHKYDPILQRDYFALQSFFAGIHWRYDLPLATPAQKADYDAKRRAWEEKAAPVLSEIAKIEKPHVANAARVVLVKFLPEFMVMYNKPAAERTPYEQQIAELIERQGREEGGNIDGRIKGTERERWSALKQKLAEFDPIKPKDPVPGAVVTDVAGTAPPTMIPGDSTRVIEPAFLTVLGAPPPKFEPTAATTGRRTALARWLTNPENPLAARVMINRVWQHHFGRGLVASSSDYGHLGEKPSHPELLDWLAARFVKEGWSLKAMHRLVLTSATWRQASVHPSPAAARLKDPDNRWLWRMNPRRLDCEEVRDGMLAASGELDVAMGGLSVDWTAPRRSVYTKVLRNSKDPLLEAFDAPENFSSVPGRNATTTATQSLLMINGRWPLERAQAFARRLNGSDAEKVDQAFRLACGRAPLPAERERSLAFLSKSAPAAAVAGGAAELPLVQSMPDRGGQAARLRNGHVEDRLRLSDMRSFPEADFTIEAIVILDSLFEDAQVRVIASQWDGNLEHRGWSLGITSEKSKHQPRNLVLQLVGNAGYEVIPSDLRIALHKTHYVAASVKIAETGESGITFTLLDLSDPEAPLRTANVKHASTGEYKSTVAFMIGGRDGQAGHGWDGLVDEVRLSRAALPKEQLLIHEGETAGQVAGYWKFESDPGFFRDSAGLQPPLTRPARLKAGPAASESGLVDFCHVLLNSNGFLYVD